jgi:hypothetical protein
MAFKMHFLVPLVLFAFLLASCSFPLLGPSTTLEVQPPASQSSGSGSVENPGGGSLPPVQAVATNTTQVLPTNTPSAEWKLVGVGCLTTTTIEITLSAGTPITGVSGVCNGAPPCDNPAVIKYSCQVVPHKVGQVYCQGKIAVYGDPLTACLQVPGSAQLVCNTFSNFQRYLGGCKCVTLYTDASSCNADAKCLWNGVSSKCGDKP